MTKSNKNFQEKGFVSIIVAATVMILLSLVTIGFTRIMQREQREALDRQLTRQATYAAESGINMVWEYIRDSSVEEQKTQCGRDGNPFNLDVGGSIELQGNGASTYVPSPYFDGDEADNSAVQITCILYDKNPPEYRSQVDQNEENLVPFVEKDGTNFSTITIQWFGDSIGYDPDCNAANYIFPESHTGTPVLKFDLYNTQTPNRGSLLNGASFFYLIPCDNATSTSSIVLDGSRSIYKEDVLCVDGLCSVTLDVSAYGSSSFFIRHKMLYASGEIILSGDDEFGATAELSGAQSVIDVTARSTDVVRRLRVHVPYNDAGNIPGAVVTVGTGDTGAVNNNGLCKDLAIVDGLSITDGCD